MVLINVLNKDSTLTELAAYYLENVVKGNFAESTYKSYKTRLENHVLPVIGNERIKNLKKMDVQNLVFELNNQANHLSGNTIRLVRSILNCVLDFALDMDLIGKNVADRIILPKQAKYRPRIYTDIEIQNLLRVAKTTKLYVPILLAVKAGLRRSEILALRWKDIDFNSKTITVTKTMRERSSGYPKTRNSCRRLQPPDSVMSELRGYWIAQNDAQSGQAYVVSKADNSPYNPSYISRLFSELLRANSLSPIRFHDLRHTYATHAHYSGMPIKELSELLGHNSAATTLDYYVHR
jgi:integrase